MPRKASPPPTTQNETQRCSRHEHTHTQTYGHLHANRGLCVGVQIGKRAPALFLNPELISMALGKQLHHPEMARGHLPTVCTYTPISPLMYQGKSK